MPLNFDTRNFTDAHREQLAWRIHEAPEWNLPTLSAWNYSLCRVHARGWEEEYREDNQVKKRMVYDRPKPGCRKCGMHFRRHQRISVAWLYFKKKALLADTMGSGKGGAYSEPILTPQGWSTYGDLRVGSEVMGRDGRPTAVEEIFELGERDIYRVVMSDRSWAEVTEDHLWEVNTPDRHHHNRPPLVLSVRQLLDRGLHDGAGARKWHIPMVEPVQYEARVLPLDPYAVGVLLGDGGLGSGSAMLSTDHEIVNALRLPTDVRPVLVTQKDAEYSADYRMVGLVPHLRALGLWETLSVGKAIPEDYLLSSVEDRVALLQGLFDTDGTPSETGVEWGTVSHRLARQVRELVLSLGGLASIQEKIPMYTYNGERRTGQTFYRLYAQIPTWLDPFRLRRKADRYVPRLKRRITRAIESIELVGTARARCIRVAASDSLYVARDFIVTHNTTSAGGLIAMLIQTGELSLHRDRSNRFGGMGRAIIVPRSPALHQWRAELLRMMPGLNVLVAEGTKRQRTQLYLQPWQVLLIGPEMLRNDYQMLERFDLSLLLTDDIDQLRNPTTETSYVLDRLGSRGIEGLRPGTDRYVIMTGTPLQKRLPELHGVLDGIGGIERLGSLDAFVKRHVRYDTVREYNRQTGHEERKQVIVGYKNLGVVKRQIAPLVLRRTASDLDDVDLPTIMPDDVFLDLYPRQREKYDELKRGVLRIIREEGVQVKRPVALAQIHYGAAICAGLAALGEADGPGTSVKLDWIQHQLTEGELSEEKTVVFVNLKNSVRALQYRLRDAGIGFVTVWGEEKDKAKRAAAQERFWEDPRCRVLIGTKSIEQSLNLQISRHLVNMDMILNPARMEQLAGRIRRDGSAYQHVFVHNLLTVRTQEERYLPLLEREAALASHIWDENSQLFNALSPMALLQLISG